MPVTVGTRLGPYEIKGSLGAGGMGEVYRATDVNLKRDVAIKVLPAAVANDHDRLARFQREAQVLAALNHPHIAQIYGLETSGGVTAIVMELVDGPTLQDLVGSRPAGIALADALPIARQIADALEVAHDRGIVHRDLKPANIKVRADGTVKVLDFGLAKAAGPGTGSEPDISNSPTMTSPAMSHAGMILGTAAYMAPEQARGRVVDKRADIWAFGCVLYEMLTGRPLFKGDDVTETIASVVKDTPDLAAAPPPVRRLLQRCLEKDPRKRLRDISGAWEILDDSAPVTAVIPVRHGAVWVPWAIVAILLVAAGTFAYLWWRTPAPVLRTLRFEVRAPSDMRFTNAYAATAISPDGRYLVFGAGELTGDPPLWLRPVDSLTARPLPGTEGGNVPFWSADSKSVAFYHAGKLKRVDILGGAPQVLCDAVASQTAGGAWSAEGIVLFVTPEGLFRVSSSGGAPPERVRTPDAARGETALDAPVFLPGGRRFLYSVASRDPNVQGIYVGSLDDPTHRARLVGTDKKSAFVPPGGSHPGYLLWLREDTLLAQPFDATALRLEGDPIPLADGIGIAGPGRRAAYWTSDSGLLATRTEETVPQAALVWMTRDGKTLGEAGAGRFGSFRLAPDGSRVAVGMEDDGGNRDIRALDLARNLQVRLTFDGADDQIPVWSPDGRQILFDSGRDAGRQLYRTGSGSGGKEEQLTKGPPNKNVTDWSRDGRWVLFNAIGPTGSDIGAMSVDGTQPPLTVLETPFSEGAATFSADGKWFAYQSNPSGRHEVYVRAFPPGPGNPWQVSSQGGSRAKWRKDGGEIYYLGPAANQQQALMAAAVRTSGASFETETPRELFRIQAVSPSIISPYDVTPDGKTFLILRPTAADTGPAPLTVVTDWRVGLRK